MWHEEGDVVEGLPVQREGKLKAYVTIIYGCNEFAPIASCLTCGKGAEPLARTDRRRSA